MTILKLFLASLLVSQIFALQGADVSCTTSTCSSCPAAPTAPGTLTWVTGGTGKCAISSCPASTSSGITGASDLFCQSCPGSGPTAIYANTALTACVVATATCGAGRTANTWTNADCLACNGTATQYAKADRSACQATPPGADVTCATATCSSCPAAPTAPGTLTWVTGGTGKCAISSCPASTSSGITGASDLFCLSCPGSGPTAIYANTALTACVVATATCGAGRTANTWTNADCLACNGTATQYAKADRSACQANPVSTTGADVTCATATCSSCPAAPTAPGTLTWVTGGTGKCAISSCPASTSSGITGASDLFCQSCPGTPNGSVQAVFANNALTGCVASTGTCGASRTANTWTNADCLACYGTTTQYAKSDKSGCQATAPSSSSTNSMIILSSVLFLISFLF